MSAIHVHDEVPDVVTARKLRVDMVYRVGIAVVDGVDELFLGVRHSTNIHQSIRLAYIVNKKKPPGVDGCDTECGGGVL